MKLPSGRHIDRSLPPNHIWAPSADHVIPKSAGGKGKLENLRAAHRKCNSIAAGKSEYERLREGSERRLQKMQEEWAAAVREDRVKRGPWGGILNPEEALGGKYLMRPLGGNKEYDR